MNEFHKSDKIIFGVMVALIAIGLLFIYSNSYAVAMARFGGDSTHFVTKQLIRGLMGVFGFFFFVKSSNFFRCCFITS